MQTLAVKYRPVDFSEVVEQGPIKSILQEQLLQRSYKNSYLFTGGAGTGKTTTARIFAAEINQHKGQPIEVDAASNNGVDNVREIIEQAKFKALDSEYKIFIVDECHMLSNGAWNAMLKLIEEPPAKTIFIFCTTDPQKIPATILSRVQRYDFQRITHKSVVSQLQRIIAWENEAILEEAGVECNYFADVAALDYIAKLADGGMRDAISLLDKCLSYSPNLTVAQVVEALGTVNYSTMFDLLAYILHQDAGNVAVLVDNIHMAGVDLRTFMKHFATFLLDVLKYSLITEEPFTYMQIPSTYKKSLEEIISWESVAFVRDRLLRIVLDLNVEIKWENGPKSLIQSTLMLAALEE